MSASDYVTHFFFYKLKEYWICQIKYEIKKEVVNKKFAVSHFAIYQKFNQPVSKMQILKQYSI